MFFGGFYLDPTYLLILVITLVISGAAQLYVRSAYRKWGKVANGSGLSGVEVGYAIVNRTDLGGSGLALLRDLVLGLGQDTSRFAASLLDDSVGLLFAGLPATIAQAVDQPLHGCSLMCFLSHRAPPMECRQQEPARKQRQTRRTLR